MFPMQHTWLASQPCRGAWQNSSEIRWVESSVQGEGPGSVEIWELVLALPLSLPPSVILGEVGSSQAISKKDVGLNILKSLSSPHILCGLLFISDGIQFPDYPSGLFPSTCICHRMSIQETQTAYMTNMEGPPSIWKRTDSPNPHFSPVGARFLCSS